MHTSHGKIQSKSIEIIYKAFIMQANMCIHIILLLFNLLCKRAHKTCFKVLAAWHQNVMYLIINEFTTKLIRTYQCMYITKSPFLRSSWLNLKLLKIRYSVYQQLLTMLQQQWNTSSVLVSRELLTRCGHFSITSHQEKLACSRVYVRVFIRWLCSYSTNFLLLWIRKV